MPPGGAVPEHRDHAVTELADRYVQQHARLDPVAATMEGIAGHDGEMTDYSPDAAEERAEHDRATLRALAAIRPGTDAAGERDRVAIEMMRDRLEISVALYELGEHLRDLNVLGSPVQGIRQSFD